MTRNVDGCGVYLSDLVLRFNPGTGRGFRVILDSEGSGGVFTVSVTIRVRWRSTWYHYGRTRKARDSRGSPFRSRSECGRVRSRIHQELGNLIIQPPSNCLIGGRSGRRIGSSSSTRTTGQVVLVGEDSAAVFGQEEVLLRLIRFRSYVEGSGS